MLPPIEFFRKVYSMTLRTQAVLSTVLATLLGSTAVVADVTAEQVWEAWSKQYAGYGYELADGGTTREGDTLVVRELSISQAVEGSSFDMTIPEVRLRELGDGTVEVTASEELKAVAKSVVPDAPEVSMDMLIRQTSTSIVSGTPEAMSYAIDAPEMTIELDQTQVGTEQNAPVKIWASLQGTTGTYDVSGTDSTEIRSVFDVAGVKFTMSGADPESGTTFSADGQLSGLKSESTSVLPAGVSFEDLPAALSAGARMDASMTYGAGNFSIDAAESDTSTQIKSTLQSGAFDFALTPELAKYSAFAKGQEFEVTSAQMPLPITGTIADASFDLGIPLSASEVPQPFNGKLALEGLSVSEQLWGMFDPQSVLPRDPATLIIDLEGEAKPLVTLYSPEAAAAQVPPIELDSLKIKQLRLALAGADLTGTGDLTFPKAADPATALPMPMPVGAIDLNLVGAKGLIDKLVTLGFVQQDQAMFAQMMLGLYAVPTGEDAMSSKIEFKDGGEILANGQRIQ